MYFFSSGREFDVKALCEGAGGDPDEEELSPDSACSAESPASHSDQPHDRKLFLCVCLQHVLWKDFSPSERLEVLKSTCCYASAVDMDSLSHVSSTGSSGVEEEEDEEESGTLLRQHFDTLAVAANGTTSLFLTSGATYKWKTLFYKCPKGEYVNKVRWLLYYSVAWI